MTKDDIIRIVKSVGADTYGTMVELGIDELLEFADLIAAAEREACAKDVSNALYGQVGCGKAIEAIRARGRSEALTNLNKAAEDMGQEL